MLAGQMREREEKGRELYCFFPKLKRRLKKESVELDYIGSQLLAGHGYFNGRYRTMGLPPSAKVFASLKPVSFCLTYCIRLLLKIPATD